LLLLWLRVKGVHHLFRIQDEHELCWANYGKNKSEEDNLPRQTGICEKVGTRARSMDSCMSLTKSLSPVRDFFLAGPALLITGYPPPGSPVPSRWRGTASRGLSLNRSQYGGCSTKYNTPAGNQVVYRRFAGEQVVFPESSHHRTHTGAVA
jgi:hypothetical protein